MKKIISNTLTVVALILFTVSIGIMFLATNAQRNNRLMYVVNTSFSLIPSDSMIGDNPDSLDRYDLVIINKKSYEDLDVGDVIVFQSKTSISGGLVNILKIHRIVSGNPTDGFVTKGDNNSLTDQDEANALYKDPLVTKDTYQGAYQSKITFIKPITKVLIESKNLIFPIVIAILLFTLTLEMIHLVKEIGNEKKKKLEEEHLKEMDELEKIKQESLYEEILKEEQEKLKQK